LSALGTSSRAVDGLGRCRGPLSEIRAFVVHWARSEHHSLRRERPSSGPLPFARFGRIGQDGLAFAPASFGRLAYGSLDPRRPALTRLGSRKPVKALRGPAPHGASHDGPPSPHRLEQPSPIRCRPLTSPVILADTASPVPEPAGGRRQLASCDARLRLIRAT